MEGSLCLAKQQIYEMSIQRSLCRWAEATTVALHRYTPISGCHAPNEKLSMLLSYRITAVHRAEDSALFSSTALHFIHVCCFNVYFFKYALRHTIFKKRLIKCRHLAFKRCNRKAPGDHEFKS